MNAKLILSILFAISLLSASCHPEDITSNTDTDTSSTQTESSSDYDWDDTNVKTITLNGSSISSSSTDVTISSTQATITAGGYYIITGTLTNGQLVVNANSEEVKIQLNGVTVSNSSTSPFFIKKAGKVIIFLPSGTTNTFTDASSYSNSDEPNSCIFSNTYLGFTGEGTLKVTGKHADGISCDDQIVIKSGTINVTAVDDGIRGKDYLVIHGGNITATSTSGHALKSDNTDAGYGYVKIDGGIFTLASTSGKGIKAANKYTQENGDITITKSFEGIESYNITMNGGTLNIISSNDGINATAGTVQGGTESNDGSSFNMTGGTLITSCTNGDAIDSNGNATVTGGIIVANGPTSGVEEAVDINGSFNMNGGVFIGAGSNSNMTKAMSTSSTQPNMYITSNSMISSSTFINIRIGTNDVITFKPKYGGYKFHLSAPAMTKGVSYTIFTGGTYSNGTNTGGYYTGGTYTEGTSKNSGTLSTSSTVNKISL